MNVVSQVRVIGAFLLGLALVACSAGKYEMAAAAPPADYAARGPMRDEAAPSRAMGGEAVALAEAPPSPDTKPDVPAPVPGTPPVTDPVRKIAPLLIYTAEFQMAVFEAKQAIDNVEGLAHELGGYLVRRDDLTIIVRVPTEKYQDALKKVGALGDVLHRSENVEDVTDQYYDLESHLRNARALRDRFEELLKQAKDVKEALMVEQELARVTGEIEVIEGKLKRMRELIRFSTITVRFQGKSSEHVEPKVNLPFPWLNQLGLPHLRSL